MAARCAARFRPVTHCIFDLDGTLVETEVIYRQIMTRIAKSYDKEFTEDLFIRQLGMTSTTATKLIVNELKLPITIEEFIRRMRGELKQRVSEIKLVEGAERLICHLAKNNIAAAIATSSAQESMRIKTQNYRALFQNFQHCVCGGSESNLRSKPAPDIFLAAAERFSNSPPAEKCLVFEDAPNGVKAARDAGMQVIMLPYKNIPPEKCVLATKVLKSLLDFKPEEFGLKRFN